MHEANNVLLKLSLMCHTIRQLTFSGFAECSFNISLITADKKKKKKKIDRMTLNGKNNADKNVISY